MTAIDPHAELQTYGEHAERAADALDALIRADQLPVDVDQIDVILGAREAVLDALKDRAHGHLDVPVHSGGLDGVRSLPMTLSRLQHDPVTQLGAAVASLPRLPVDQRPSPVDVLGRAPSDPIARAWVTAARELQSANHVLDQTSDQAWRAAGDAGKAAQLALAADTAQVLEAVTVLDSRLAEVGVFTGRLHSPAGVEPDRAAVRLLTGHLDRLGLQHGEHASLDLSHITPAVRPNALDPIQLIHTPGDIAAAQRHLTKLLAPMAEQTSPYVHMTSRISALMANTISINQHEVIKQLHLRIAGSPQLRNQLVRVTQLRELHDDVRQALLGLHDVRPPFLHRVLRYQQQEISVSVAGGAVRRLSDQQAVDLLSATEGVMGKWAAAVLAEAERPKGRLRIIRRLRLAKPPTVKYGRLTPGGPGVRALTALAQYAPAPEVTTKLVATQVRDDLRQSLASSSLAERPPHLRRARSRPTDRSPHRGR